MAQIPPCPNHLAGSCERSDTIVAGEKQDCFVIKCRTCGGLNIFPYDKAESAGRYNAFLKKCAAREAQIRYESSRPEFSLPSMKG